MPETGDFRESFFLSASLLSTVKICSMTPLSSWREKNAPAEWGGYIDRSVGTWVRLGKFAHFGDAPPSRHTTALAPADGHGLDDNDKF